MKHDNFIKKLTGILNTGFSRRRFLELLGLGFLAVLFSGKYGRKAYAKTDTLQPRKGRKVKTDCDLAAAKGSDPERITREAVEALGGMKKFVQKHDIVVIKPNIAWNRTPEQAANTNPAVVAALVKMCREAGAKRVKVFDRTCNDARMTYEKSGIRAAAKKAKAQVSYVSDWKFIPGRFGKDCLMDEWPVYRDAVECDCFINAPVAKHHGLAGLTISIKNLMGVCGGTRGRMHADLGVRMAEVTEFIKPELTVVDAYRILLRHGPTGGDLADVEKKETVIASADPVLADAYTAALFGIKPAEIDCIRESGNRGLGSMDLKKADIKTVNVR